MRCHGIRSLLLLVVLHSSASAAIIASYDFNGAANPDLAVDIFDPNITATPISKGPGGTFNSQSGY